MFDLANKKLLLNFICKSLFQQLEFFNQYLIFLILGNQKLKLTI